MKKKIIFFINDLDFFISHRLRIAQKLDKKKFEIYVACPKNHKSQKILKKNNISFLNLDLQRTKMNFYSEFITLTKTYKILFKIKPDIIHLITLKPIIYGGLLALLFKKIMVVFSIAGLGHIFFNRRMYLRRNIFIQLIKIAIKFNKSILIFQNKESITHFKKLNILEKNTKYILTKGSGVDLKIFKPKRNTRTKIFKVLLASRMVWEKGVKEFVGAHKILNQKKLNIKFILAGRVDSDSPSAIDINYLKNLNIKKNSIQWIGFQSNIKKIINTCNVVVLPSYHEGAPKVLLEASACGKPIIASNINGCREIVKNNYNGFLIPIKNSILLAKKIETLYLNKKLYKKMSKNNIIESRKFFSVEEVVKKHIKIYDQ